jgi:hypothetical protein
MAREFLLIGVKKFPAQGYCAYTPRSVLLVMSARKNHHTKEHIMSTTYAVARITSGRYTGQTGAVLDFNAFDGMAKIELGPGQWSLFETFEFELIGSVTRKA